MKLKAVSVCGLLLFGFVYAEAQQPAQQPTDPIGDNFFAPELVMQHQQAIGLTEEQKEFFKSEFRKAQIRFTELQWQLQDEAEKMAGLARQEQVNEQLVLSQLDKVLAAEREIKRLQMSLVIQIKNKLTNEQRMRLMEIKTRGREK
ncbi:MAG TPA: periplasmic heavy metal sensor [Blastocatellia bacterium]|nr:periplasmic heavy metal sensor [Blastocatellia bacterium]